MKIINSDELQKRTICFICERDREGLFVDTRKDFFPIGKTQLDGRKYVCERCVQHMAEVSGFKSQEDFDLMHDHRDEIAAELGRALAAGRSHQDVEDKIQELIAVLGPYKPVAPAPKKAAVKPVPVKEEDDGSAKS